MNLDGDLTSSESVTQALAWTLFDCVNRVVVDCLAEMDREWVEQVSSPNRRRTSVHREHNITPPISVGKLFCR